jgi:hypothetical protein
MNWLDFHITTNHQCLQGFCGLAAFNSIHYPFCLHLSLIFQLVQDSILLSFVI